MNDRETVRVTFKCTHCGSVNELTAARLHEATMIHCSHCAASVAPLAVLAGKPVAELQSQPAMA